MGTELFAQVATDNHDINFTIPEIALLDIESNNPNFTLELTPPTEAGYEVTRGGPARNNQSWLNYSSSVVSGNSRSITAEISSGSIPPGLRLRLRVNDYSGNGSGNFGTSVGAINLSDVPQVIISNIQGCFTGDGRQNGHRLRYFLRITDYSLLEYGTYDFIQVTYTITD